MRGKRDRRGGFRGKAFKKAKKESAAAEDGEQRNKDAWDRQVIDFSNEHLLKYFRAQQLVPEDEVDAVFEAYRRQLPVSFRINLDSPCADALRESLERQWVPRLTGLHLDDGKPVDPPSAIAWYPKKGFAWQLPASKKDLRKVDAFKDFHAFVHQHSEMGDFTRQEQVSMIPAAFFDIEPHHRILDICAAPGSKTTQLLELLAANASAPRPVTGCVVANDVDAKRCFLLSHQLQRMPNLCPYAVITHEDAKRFPRMCINEKPALFDCILADVVCSGDGTLRKSPDIWARWSPKLSNALHGEQVGIATHAFHLLAPGGSMVYSTCSVNPVEDEAVVAELLRRFPGELELVDCSQRLPELKRLPGIHKWVVMDKNHELYSRFDQVPEQVRQSSAMYRPSLFPPSEEEESRMHLERCMRILPHLQDTGGFFIAVLRKTLTPAGPKMQAAVPEPLEQLAGDDDDDDDDGDDDDDDDGDDDDDDDQEEEKGRKADQKDDDDDGAAGTGANASAVAGATDRGKEGSSSAGSHPFVPVEASRLAEVKTYLAIDDEFFKFHSLLTRLTDDGHPSGSISFVGRTVYDILKSRSGPCHIGLPRMWRVVDAGLKGIETNTAPGIEHRFRFGQDAAMFLARRISKSLVLRVSMSDFCMMLRDRRILTYAWSPETRLALESIPLGPFLLVPDVSSTPHGAAVDPLECGLVISAQRTRFAVAHFLAFKDNQGFRDRLRLLTGVDYREPLVKQ